MKIAILGYGTVGRGVDEIVMDRVEGVEVARILELPDRITDARMTSNYDEIAGDESIDLVVECMGGVEPAHTFIIAALKAGKAVVTSNKAVVAAHFDEFAAVAKENDTSILIEATCGGGIPWIASIVKARRVDDIEAFWGIMNGTTNYIVDAMVKEGADFGEVLKRAQELGYAEADPSADIDGIDVKNKTIIAASVAFDVACTKDLPVMGLRNLRKSDLDTLAGMGRGIKLLGRGVQQDGRYAASVEPVAVQANSLEANVPSNFNLVSLVGTTVGELKFYGQGAGMLPTGNAMVQDIIDFAQGVRPTYDFSRGLTYDPDLLKSDYVLRATVAPEGGEPFADGMWKLSDLSAEAAARILTTTLADDPTAFMASLPQED